MAGYDYLGQFNLSGFGLSQQGDFGGALGMGFSGGLYNLVSGGDLEYARQLESMGMQNAYNASQAQLERDFSSAEAQKNRDWQERMSSTAYSRAAEDLKSIGINPYAMMSGFSSASTPSGSSASGSSARSGSGFSGGSGGLGSLISSAFSLATTVLGLSTKREIAKLNADVSRDVASMYTNNALRLAELPDITETYNYSGDGRLLGRSVRRKN